MSNKNDLSLILRISLVLSSVAICIGCTGDGYQNIVNSVNSEKQKVKNESATGPEICVPFPTSYNEALRILCSDSSTETPKKYTIYSFKLSLSENTIEATLFEDKSEDIFSQIKVKRNLESDQIYISIPIKMGELKLLLVPKPQLENGYYAFAIYDSIKNSGAVQVPAAQIWKIGNGDDSKNLHSVYVTANGNLLNPPIEFYSHVFLSIKNWVREGTIDRHYRWDYWKAK